MCKAVVGNYRKFRAPGSEVERKNTRVVEDSFELRVRDPLRFVLTGLWVIDNPSSLFLLSSGILCGGCKAPNWNYVCISLITESGDSTISGFVRFRWGFKVE